MKFDLHNHTIYSDGKCNVRQLIELAKSLHLKGIALTDHDSMYGVDEAYTYGKELGVYVFKGMELTTSYKNQIVHIVALFNENNPDEQIKNYGQVVIDKRIKRAKKMMKQIEDIYHVNVDYDYLFKGTIITRGNMLNTLIHSNPDYDPYELSKMIANDSKAYIPADLLPTKEGLAYLRKHHAFCILAHPTLIKVELLEEIINLGFDGIESRYPKNKDNEEQKFNTLAHKYKLFNSAGSDYHGDINHAMMGTSTIDENEIKPLLEALNINHNEVYND